MFWRKIYLVGFLATVSQIYKFVQQHIRVQYINRLCNYYFSDLSNVVHVFDIRSIYFKESMSKDHF